MAINFFWHVKTVPISFIWNSFWLFMENSVGILKNKRKKKKKICKFADIVVGVIVFIYIPFG